MLAGCDPARPVGMDTRRALVFVLFCLVAAPLLVGAALFLRRRRHCASRAACPADRPRAVGRTSPSQASSERGTSLGPLSLAWGGPLPRGISAECSTAYLEPAGAQAVRFRVRLRAEAARPLRAAAARPRAHRHLRPRARPRPVDAPTRYRLSPVLLDRRAGASVGRRYQPGGIPLASTVGDSLEFAARASTGRATRRARSTGARGRGWAGPSSRSTSRSTSPASHWSSTRTCRRGPARRTRALRSRDRGARVAGRALRAQRGRGRHPGGRARPVRGEHRAQPGGARQRAGGARGAAQLPGAAFEAIAPQLFDRLRS